MRRANLFIFIVFVFLLGFGLKAGAIDMGSVPMEKVDPAGVLKVPLTKEVLDPQRKPSSFFDQDRAMKKIDPASLIDDKIRALIKAAVKNQKCDKHFVTLEGTAINDKYCEAHGGYQCVYDGSIDDSVCPEGLEMENFYESAYMPAYNCGTKGSACPLSADQIKCADGFIVNKGMSNPDAVGTPAGCWVRCDGEEKDYYYNKMAWPCNLEGYFHIGNGCCVKKPD